MERLCFVEDVAEERRPEARAGEHCCGEVVCGLGLIWSDLVLVCTSGQSRGGTIDIDDARLGRKQLAAAEMVT